MRLADGPPLDPSSDVAHDWLATELRRPEYTDVPSIWERLLTWLRDHLHALDGTGSGFAGTPPWLLVVLVLGVLGAIAYAVLRTVRSERRTARPGPRGGVLGGPRHTAAQYRADAATALAAQDWDTAVLCGFRALAAGVVERSVLEESPGRTADEVARETARYFRAEEGALWRAATAFDAVRYGRLPATEADARHVVDAEARVHAARPGFDEATAGGSR